MERFKLEPFPFLSEANLTGLVAEDPVLSPWAAGSAGASTGTVDAYRRICERFERRVSFRPLSGVGRGVLEASVHWTDTREGRSQPSPVRLRHGGHPPALPLGGAMIATLNDRRGSGAVILLSFITLTILFIMGMWQWFTVSYTRSRRRAKEFTLARLLGESALNEVEAVLREQVNIARDDERFRPLHLGAREHAFTYDPVETRALAAEVYGVSDPFEEEVMVFSKSLPITGAGTLSEGFPRPDLPDETEGTFVALVLVNVGATTIKVHRVLEFKQLRLCPPWGFDQTAFAALDWKYYHDRFTIFTEEVLTFLAQRKAFRDTASKYLREKKAACDWAVKWHTTVRGVMASKGLNDADLDEQLQANATANEDASAGGGRTIPCCATSPATDGSTSMPWVGSLRR